MAHGIVVDHLESGVRYAISERNFNEKVHRLVRPLKPGETVLGFRPVRKDQRASTPATLGQAGELVAPKIASADDPSTLPQTEGSSSEGTQDSK